MVVVVVVVVCVCARPDREDFGKSGRGPRFPIRREGTIIMMISTARRSWIHALGSGRSESAAARA